MSNNFYTNVSVHRDFILHVGYEDGKRFLRRVPYKPYLFLPSRNPTEYSTLDGSPVGKMDFDSIRDARNFLKENENVSNQKIYGLEKFVYTFLYDTYLSQGQINYDPSLIGVCPIDIEVSIAKDRGFPNIQEAANPVTLITMGDRNRKLVTLGCGDYQNNEEDVEYFKCADEKALLRTFVDLLSSPRFSPDVLTGWNVELFDIPYLINRITRVLGDAWAKKISPWGILQERRIEIMGKENQVYVPVGITILDYLPLYRKFAYTQQESYKLDHIAREELGEAKVEYEGTLADLEVNDYQTYTRYNIQDTRLIFKLDDKLKLIDLVYAMAYDAGVNFQDTFTTVGLWDIIIHNHLMRKSIVVHQADRQNEKESILGGYVKDPKVGMYNWVVSLDLNSLYPHIIMQYNISPETFVGWIPEEGECQNKDQAEARVLRILDGAFDQYSDMFKQQNVTATANMCIFSREKQGFLPALMQRMYSDRVVYKDQMIKAKQEYELPGCDKVQLEKDISRLNNLQMAKKIQMNSMYGSMANIWNRWFRREFAEGITSSGQLTTRWIERKLNEYLNKTLKTVEIDYVIAADTDSVYIRLDVLIDSMYSKDQQRDEKEKILRFIDRVCQEKLEPFIDKCYDELAAYTNAYDQKMKMKRECIADKGIWTGKKHYILNVYNQEGVLYAKPKLKMMGIEAIRTSTPAVVRAGIKQALEVMMNKTEQDLQDYVAEFKQEFLSLPFEQVAFPRSVRDLGKYKDSSTIYAKGTPINVKGALVYNHHLKKHNLERKYESVVDGQKIKYAYLKTPNPVHSTVITCPDKLPAELNLEKYIDKGMQFDKSFIEPIKKIVGAIGWEVEKRATLEDFFV